MQIATHYLRRTVSVAGQIITTITEKYITRKKLEVKQLEAKHLGSLVGATDPLCPSVGCT